MSISGGGGERVDVSTPGVVRGKKELCVCRVRERTFEKEVQVHMRGMTVMNDEVFVEREP